LVGAGIALLLAVVSGFTPAYQAAKLPVVQALRRVE
jgi:ABC-type lipoprotein release transport system permease subunit